MNPVLLERQILRLAEAADNLVKNLPPLELKPLLNGNKKRINKDIEVNRRGKHFSTFESVDSCKISLRALSERRPFFACVFTLH